MSEEKISRRKYIKYAAAGVVVVGAAAAGAYYYISQPGPTPTPTPTPTPKPTPTPTGPTPTPTPKPTPTPTGPTPTPTRRTIVATGIEGFPELDAIKKLLPNFTSKSGIEVTYSTQSYATVLEKNLIDLAAGRGAYDALHVETIWWGDYFPFLYPLDEFIENPNLFDKDEYDFDDFMPGTIEYVTVDGKLYGLSYVNGIPLLWYRKDLLEEAGVAVPKNVEEYYEAAKALTKKRADGTIEHYGCCISGARTALLDEWISFWTGYMVLNRKEIPKNVVLYEDWSPAFNNEEGRMALELYYKLFKECAPPESINYEFGEAIGAMASGLVAMQWNWPNAAHLLDDPTFSKVVGKVRAAYAWPGRLGLNCYSIPKDSKNKEDAFRFIVWVTGKEMTKEITRISGNVPVRRSTLEDPEIQKIRWHFPALIESYKTALRYPKIPEWSEIDDAMSISFSKILTGELTINQALSEAETAVKNILKEAGYLK